MFVFKPTSSLFFLFLLIISYSASSVTSLTVPPRGGAPLDLTTTPQQQTDGDDDSLTYLWPLPAEFTSGGDTLSVDPALTLSVAGNGGGSAILREAFGRYRGIVFKNTAGVGFSFIRKLRERLVSSVSAFDVDTLKITVHSDNEEVRVWALNFFLGL